MDAQSFIKEQESLIKKIIKDCGYDIENVELLVSSRPDLGQYQFNGVMGLAKKYKKNPRIIAEEIVKKMENLEFYDNINIAGPGFLNITFSDKVLVKYMNDINKDIDINSGKVTTKKILIDYGGPNVAKTLHVGHLRSANIGEALKGLCKELNCEVLADVHLGDWGRQMGLVMLELKKRYPDWVYFKDNYDGEYPLECPITNDDLEKLYPIASLKAKEDESYLQEAREITTLLQNKDKGYYELWKQIVKISVDEIKKTYDKLNISFDLWKGESDADQYIPDVINYLKEKNLVHESEGSLVMDVSMENDTCTIPPILLIKSNGAVSYELTDLATLWERVKLYNLDEIWYVVDNRQSLHFEQVFRAAYKSGIVPDNVKLEFLGFGTMNGKDGKPFKTRDGGVMTLKSLIELVKNETLKKLSPDITEAERNEISDIIAVSALKYADLLPNRTTDYVFDPVKFSDLTGKTGVYLLYSTIRIRALLRKAKEKNIPIGPINVITNEYDRKVVLNLLQNPVVLEKSFYNKSINEIAEYIYRLTNSYNNFYSSNRILTEENSEVQRSWLGLSENVLKTNEKLLKILGIKVPKKM